MKPRWNKKLTSSLILSWWNDINRPLIWWWWTNFSGKFCGNKISKPVIKPSENKVFVKFTSDDSNGGRGFKISWSSKEIAAEKTGRILSWWCRAWPSGYVRNHLQTYCKVYGENLPALCNSRLKAKRNHKVWSHREEGPWSHYLISLLIQCLAHCALHI